jgi:hypothetical protein
MPLSLQPYIDKSITYPQYRNLIDSLLAQDKTTGDHPADYVAYTRLNVTRMERLDKTATFTNELIEVLQNLKRKYIWLVITEGWCGDAAQSLPIINLMALQNPNIDLKLVLRDEKGNLVAASLKPVIYNNAARPPFANAIKGAAWVDKEVKPDPSSGVKGVQVSAPVMDGGKAIGVLHSAVNAD